MSLFRQLPVQWLVLLFANLIWNARATGNCSVTDDSHSEHCFSAAGSQKHGSAMLQSRATVEEQAISARRVGVEALSKRGGAQQMSGARAKVLRQQYAVHNKRLIAAVGEASASISNSNNELDDMITQFIENQQKDTDHCPAQLLEAKHQLNILLTTMVDISWQVNTTEVQLSRTLKDIEILEIQIKEHDDACQKKDDKCDEEWKEIYEMWLILKWELKEMYMIANPQSYMASADIYAAAAASVSTSTTSGSQFSTGTYSTGTYSTGSYSSGQATTGAVWSSSSTTSGNGGWTGGTSTTSGTTSGTTSSQSATTSQSATGGTRLSLLQESNVASIQRAVSPRNGGKLVTPDKAGVESTRQLVKKTKELAKDLTECMKNQNTLSAHGALLQVGADKQGPAWTTTSSTSGGTTTGGTSGSTSSSTGWSWNLGTSGTTSGGGFSTSGATGWGDHIGESCKADWVATVTLGTITKKVSAGQVLAAGQHSYVECASVNEAFKGMIWLVCMGGMLVPDYSHCSTATAECKQQLYYLEITYVKAYVELTRLVSEYEKLVNNTDCKDTVKVECEGVGREMYHRLDKMTLDMTKITEEITAMKGKIKLESKAEAALRARIAILTTRCQEMEATESSLDKVRDVIHVLGACPGLGRPEFHIPKWVGTFVEVHVDPTADTDEEIDAKMTEKCKDGGMFEGFPVRAAETGEIEQNTIEGMPLKNTAKVPLMGACPGCAGDMDEPEGPSHSDGHFRTCWDNEASLTSADMRTDCSKGLKAVMCVVDRGDMREMWGQLPDTSSSS